MNQHVIYSEFLPRLLGPSRIFTYGLQLQNEGYYASYDPHCAANGINEFAAAAFRFGHSLIRPHLARMDQRYSGMSPHIPLRDGFFNSDMLYKVSISERFMLTRDVLSGCWTGGIKCDTLILFSFRP